MFLLAIVQSRRIWGLFLGVGQLIGAVVVLVIYEHRNGDSTGSLGTTVAVWQGLAPCAIVAVTVTIVEGIPMITKEWGKKHREAGRQESTKEWQNALEQAAISPEQKAKIEEALAAIRAEREKEPT